MSNEITSIHNTRVKQWQQLLHKKGRDEQNRFLVEGIHLVEEAVRSNAEVETVLYSLEREIPAELRQLFGQTTEWVGVSEAVLRKCAETQTPQSVLAVVKKTGAHSRQFIQSPPSLAVAVDGVQDPGNVGTIIRSADAAGADGILLGKGSADLYNPKTVRATMGSLFHLPIAEGELPALLREAREKGVQLVCASLRGDRTCYEIDFTLDTWIVVGNEGKGVSAEVSAWIDRQAAIPMQGKAESLNAAMAATIMLYEALRQRHFSGQAYKYY